MSFTTDKRKFTGVLSPSFEARELADSPSATKMQNYEQIKSIVLTYSPGLTVLEVVNSIHTYIVEGNMHSYIMLLSAADVLYSKAESFGVQNTSFGSVDDILLEGVYPSECPDLDSIIFSPHDALEEDRTTVDEEIAAELGHPSIDKLRSPSAKQEEVMRIVMFVSQTGDQTAI